MLIMMMISSLFMLTLLLILITNLISKKKMFYKEKFSPFECGFNPLCSNRTPFSIHFFIISITFLIFDVEISIIFPLILSMNISNMFYWSMLTSLFMLILIIGILYEWNNNLLNWKF